MKGWSALAGRTQATVRRLLALAVLSAQPAAAQSVSYHSFEPPVLTAGGPAQVLFLAEVTGDPSRVTLDFSPGQVGAATPIDLHDDGRDGDRVAGDRVYSVLLPSANILNATKADDVHRVFVGFLNLFNGTTSVFRGNIFTDVYTSEAGRYPIAQLSPTIQATTRLVNIHDPAYFTSGDIARVTREFYRWFGDDYDFFDIVYHPARFQNRTHFRVKNEVDGIGISRTNNTAVYGSSGRLAGISQFPIPGYFDGAENGHIHELGHQWINYLGFAPFAVGIPHWPVSSMAGGVMGFSIGGTGGQGGTFACNVVDQNGTIVLNPRPNEPVYNDLELYLMGLLPPDQVRQQVVFVDEAGVLSRGCSGQTYTGAVTRVSAQDVIARYGSRNPPAGQAPARFRVATILVTRDGLAPREAMWLYSWFVDRAEWRAPVPIHSGFAKQIGMPFYVATGRRATLDMRVALAEPDFTMTPTPGTATVAAGAPATFTISTLPTRRSFDADVALSCGPLPSRASCSFSQPQVRPGADGADVILTVATQDPVTRTAPGTYVITVLGTAGSVQHATVVSLTVQ